MSSHTGSIAPGNRAYRMGCRCFRCCLASSEYIRKRTEAIAAGTWHPWADAQPVREHIIYLSKAGLGYRQVAKLVGVNHDTIQHIVTGRCGRGPNRKVRTETAAAILALQPGIDTARDGAYIDSTGTRRRLQALIAAGYPGEWLDAHLGVSRGRSCEVIKSTLVTAALARTIRSAYDVLSLRRPDDLNVGKSVSSYARNRAARAGWPVPFAWDEETIDDPAAEPYREEPKELSRNEAFAQLVEDTTWLVKKGGGIDLTDNGQRADLAEKLGITTKKLNHVLDRGNLAPAGRN